MSKVPTFGFSAFLRLISLNEAPQKTAIRERYSPSKVSGYDFHRSLRLALQHLNSGSSTASELLSSLSLIKKTPERHSAKRGVIRYLKWRKLNPGAATNCDSVFVESPNSLFKVRFDADCVIRIDDQRVAIHIWNTKGTKLSRNLVLAALALVQRNWPKNADTADDFAVLSLQDMKLYRWSDDPKAYQGLADNLMIHLERLCRTSMEAHEGTKPIAPPDQPPTQA